MNRVWAGCLVAIALAAGLYGLARDMLHHPPTLEPAKEEAP